MTRYHTTAFGNIPFTQDEEAEFDALQAISALPKVPQSVDRLKAVALLDQMGLGAAYLAWCKSPDRTLLEQEMLICTRVWERNNPTLIAAATAMSITSDQLDQMFIQVGY